MIYVQRTKIRQVTQMAAAFSIVGADAKQKDRRDLRLCMLQEYGETRMKILIKSAWGSDDPTKAAFAFLHANAFAEAGHEVQIFLLGEAVSLMKDAVMNSVVPVGWPPLSETIPKTIQHKVPLHI